MPFKHTVTSKGGHIHTRTSANRQYAFAVIRHYRAYTWNGQYFGPSSTTVWSSREDLARKEATRHSDDERFLDAEIIPCVPVATGKHAKPVAPVADDNTRLVTDDPSRLDAARLVRILDKIYTVYLSSGEGSIVSLQCRLQNKRKVFNQVLNNNDPAWARAALLARLAKANDRRIGVLMINGQTVYYDSVHID